MKYTIEMSDIAIKALEKIPKKDRLKIMEKIDSLEEDPMPIGSIKLQGYRDSIYRIRFGNYRIVYSLKKDVFVVLIIEIGHRRQIYR